MFTGLVDDVGVIDAVRTTEAGRELSVRCRYDDLQPGESVAVSGVCMTVLQSGAQRFTCAAFAPTLEVTTIGDWVAGRPVNLERALRATDRLGGHFVQGHVDAVARVDNVQEQEDALLLDLAVPDTLSDLMVQRGSIAVDGVSLTIQTVLRGHAPFGVTPTHHVVRVGLIRHTRQHTTLGALRVGDRVHIEADMLAKHVRKLLAPHMTHDE